MVEKILGAMIENILDDDINRVALSESLPWNSFQDSIFLVTGATGFIGKWFVEILAKVAKTQSGSIEIMLVVRDMKKATEIFPISKYQNLKFIHADLSGSNPFAKHDLSRVTHILHGATSTNKSADPNELMTSTVNGLENVIRATSVSRNVPRLINLSSGAVYGEQARQKARINDQESVISIESALDVYARAKVSSEILIGQANSADRISGVNARLFSFVGPHLPIDSAYAVPNFIADVIAGRKIQINASAETTRSYLYPSDLVSTLLQLFATDFKGSVNVGSRNSLNMLQIATTVNQAWAANGIEFKHPNAIANHYVPSLDVLDQVIGKQEEISFEESISKWKKWIDSTLIR